MAKILWSQLEEILVGVVPSQVGNDGIPVGSIGFNPAGVWGNCIEACDGSNYVKWTTPLTKAQLGTEWSIDFWWKPNYNSSSIYNQGVIGFGDPSGYSCASMWGIGVWGTFGIWVCGNYGPSMGCSYLFKPVFTAGVWYGVELSFKESRGDGDRIRLYINNIQIPFDSLYIGFDSSPVFANDCDFTTWSIGLTGNNTNDKKDDIVLWDEGLEDFSNYIYEGRVFTPTISDGRVIWF
jgi:hypothetical protein